MNHPSPPPAPASVPCGSCGADLHFKPGTAALQCPYCGHQQKIGAPERRVREHSFAKLAQVKRERTRFVEQELVCQGCGAHVQGEGISFACQFCASPLVADSSVDPQVPPEAVLPFQVDTGAARDGLRTWARTRWFAPNGLKRIADAESMRSTYLPHWTYDARTESDYRGKRGEYYYVTETYTVTEDGKTETRTRKVRKTRWHPARGTVSRRFDDVLVHATTKVPEDHLARLEPWPLKKAVAFDPRYLAGHQALRYDVEPEAGLDTAKEKMAEVIRRDVRKDIGGDTQRIDRVDTAYAKVTYKHMLLPVWVGSYMFNGRSWQVLVNGCTGEVQGERPYSPWKIAAAVLAALVAAAVAVGLYLFFQDGPSETAGRAAGPEGAVSVQAAAEAAGQGPAAAGAD
ncbi:hypothetical protein [Nocardiopsis potens]|uniref:hypothetical protein n=1 Tax=Nocardiopsis potens TaxID=1246458 RepID=UPI000348F29E|nr:hypothetical protein [Nocardiopsis potens]